MGHPWLWNHQKTGFAFLLRKGKESVNRSLRKAKPWGLQFEDSNSAVYYFEAPSFPLDSFLLLGAVEGKLKHMWNFTWTLLLFEVFLLEFKSMVIKIS